MSRGRSVSRRPYLLALYLACVVLVCSFILFEVLDVDGSDFPTPPARVATIKLAEAPHDIRREAFRRSSWTPVEMGLVGTERVHHGYELQAEPLPSRLGTGGALAVRTVLPRASLDSLPSA